MGDSEHNYYAFGPIKTPKLPTWLPRYWSGKESVGQCRKHKRQRFDPWIEKIPWRKKWQAASVFLTGKFHGQGAWQTTVHGVAKCQTRLSDSTTTKMKKARVNNGWRFVSKSEGSGLFFSLVLKWHGHCVIVLRWPYNINWKWTSVVDCMVEAMA